MPTTSPYVGRGRASDAVLHLINTSGAITRTELVEHTRLSLSTVGQAVARLLEEGLIFEVVQEKGPGSGSGRPAHVLKAAGQGIPVGAIDFGHGHFRVALGDDAGVILDEADTKLDVDLLACEALDLACAQLKAMMERHGVGPLAAVVAGVPGPVEAASGEVRSPTILSSWVGLAPREELESRLGCPVHVENDAVLGAMGELRHGAGVGVSDFVYVKSSHGVGAAMVFDGELYRGATGLAGEIGHTQLSGFTQLCRCGSRGCLEAVVTLPSVLEEIAFTHPQLRAEQISLAELDDPVTRRILKERGRTLGSVLARLANLLNPSTLILGGELGASGSAFLEGIEESVQRYSLPSIADALTVSAAGLNGRSELVGALHLAGDLTRV